MFIRPVSSCSNDPCSCDCSCALLSPPTSTPTSHPLCSLALALALLPSLLLFRPYSPITMSRIDPCHVCGNFVLHRGNWTLVKCRTCIRLQTILRPGAVARNIVDKLVKAVFERRLPLSLLLQSPSPPPSPPPSPSPFLSPYSPMIETILIPRSIYASSSWPKPLSRSQRHSDFHSDSSYLHSPPSSSNVHEQRQSSNSFGRNPVTQHSHSHSPSLDSSPSSSKVNKWWEWQRHRQPNELRNDRRPATTTTRICQLSTAHYSPQSQQDLSPLPSSTRTRTSAQVGHSPPSVLEDPKGLENVLQGVAKLSYATLRCALVP